jgi:hypothetical protein
VRFVIIAYNFSIILMKKHKFDGVSRIPEFSIDFDYSPRKNHTLLNAVLLRKDQRLQLKLLMAKDFLFECGVPPKSFSHPVNAIFNMQNGDIWSFVKLTIKVNQNNFPPFSIRYNQEKEKVLFGHCKSNAFISVHFRECHVFNY